MFVLWPFPSTQVAKVAWRSSPFLCHGYIYNHPFYILTFLKAKVISFGTRVGQVAKSSWGFLIHPHGPHPKTKTARTDNNSIMIIPCFTEDENQSTYWSCSQFWMRITQVLINVLYYGAPPKHRNNSSVNRQLMGLGTAWLCFPTLTLCTEWQLKYWFSHSNGQQESYLRWKTLYICIFNRFKWQDEQAPGHQIPILLCNHYFAWREGTVLTNCQLFMVQDKGFTPCVVKKNFPLACIELACRWSTSGTIACSVRMGPTKHLLNSPSDARLSVFL